MANTAADHSGVTTFPAWFRITITDADHWLAITVPPDASYVTLTAISTAAKVQSGVANDAAIGTDYGDLVAGAPSEIRGGLPLGTDQMQVGKRATTIGVGSTTASQVVEVIYEART